MHFWRILAAIHHDKNVEEHARALDSRRDRGTAIPLLFPLFFLLPCHSYLSSIPPVALPTFCGSIKLVVAAVRLAHA